MNVVIDASVAVKWFLPESETEPGVDRAVLLLREIQEGQLHPIQPPHWLAEVGAVIARLRPSISRQAVELLLALELPVDGELNTYRRAVQLATELEHHLFDTLYQAVALERGITTITADEHYLRKAESLGGLRRLSDWET